MHKRAIAHVLPWANVAGTEIATLRLADAARAAGYDNLIYVPDVPEAAAFETFVAGFGFQAVRYRQVTPERRRPWRYAWNVLRLAADLRRRGVVLVHCGDVMGAYFTALAGRLAGVQVISHVRCDHGTPSRLEQWLLRPVQRLIFVSEDTRQSQTLGCSAEEEVLYDGVAPPATVPDAAAARQHYGLPEGAYVVGMAARFSPQKDHATLIHAAALLAGACPNLRFLMVGQHDAPAARDYFAGLEALMAETGTRPLFHFAGLEPDMSRFYAAIDVKVLATHFEGLPLVLIEAMAAGLPVVASRVSGIPEIVAEEDTGLLVPAQRPDLLAKAIRRLIEEPDLARAMGDAGRRRVAEKFSAETHARNVAAFYRRLLGPPPAVTPPSVP